jgi:uncharacterized protein (UPF0548 family)
MFLRRRPSAGDIERFLDQSRSLPLSYGPAGIVRHGLDHPRSHEYVIAIGNGKAAFDRACVALAEWAQFDVGWVELWPKQAPIEPGTVVAVLIRHFGFWSLNGARVLYQVDSGDRATGFGFAYGTLTNLAESGEELFEVNFDQETGNVLYRIRAVSWPQSPLARVGHPLVRFLQARFRRDSAAALERAVSGNRR